MENPCDLASYILQQNQPLYIAKYHAKKNQKMRSGILAPKWFPMAVSKGIYINLHQPKVPFGSIQCVFLPTSCQPMFASCAAFPGLTIRTSPWPPLQHWGVGSYQEVPVGNLAHRWKRVKPGGFSLPNTSRSLIWHWFGQILKKSTEIILDFLE